MWSFVQKKEKSCDPADEADLARGDQWDFVVLDPDSRLVLGVFVGKRLQGNAESLLGGVKRRLAGPPELITSDECRATPRRSRRSSGWW
jgi:hypothetical protein